MVPNKKLHWVDKISAERSCLQEYTQIIKCRLLPLKQGSSGGIQSFVTPKNLKYWCAMGKVGAYDTDESFSNVE